jgi:L-aminopeptidase/D-esterase-like protein
LDQFDRDGQQELLDNPLGCAGRVFKFMAMLGAITDVGGIKVGHYTDTQAVMGCTVVLSFNTIIGVVATDAKLSKAEASKLARAAQVGIARTIDPCHTVHDGDALFALSLGDREANVSALGAAAAEVVAEAIVRAIQKAETLAGVPAAKDIREW